MQKYRVVDIWTQERQLVLRCSAGRFHLARALGVLPHVGAVLHGDSPHRGFALLLCQQAGTIHRVIFESINHATRLIAPMSLIAPSAQIATSAMFAPGAMPDARHRPCMRSTWPQVAGGG